MIDLLPINSEVAERVGRLQIPFNRHGIDPYGISQDRLRRFFTAMAFLYRRYFKVRCFGISNVPDTGRGVLIGNHSGGLPVDGGMLLAALLLEHEPPRLAHGMVEKFAQQWPFVSQLFCRIGQLPGLREHAVRLLEDDRLLMVFPEGARGTGKLYKDRYKLVRFGTGFMRLALQTRSPILPFAFIGGEEALPTLFHAKTLARLTGAPYWPVPPYLFPWPQPFPCQFHFGEPVTFEGDGTEPDDIVEGYVSQVKEQIAGLIEEGREHRRNERSGSRWRGQGTENP